MMAMPIRYIFVDEREIEKENLFRSAPTSSAVRPCGHAGTAAAPEKKFRKYGIVPAPKKTWRVNKPFSP